MPRVNKPKPRDVNHDILKEKYAEAETTPQQKVMINIILNLYKTGFIYTHKMADKLINKYRETVANKQKQHNQFRNQMIKYISKPSKSLEKLNTTLDRGREAIEQIEDRNLVNNIEHIDGNKPLTTIKLNLNTNPAFPDMPDLIDDSYSTTVIPESFENGPPNRDANIELLLSRLKDKIIKQVRDALENKESIKIQLGSLLQLYKLRTKDNELEYVQSNQHTPSETHLVIILNINKTVFRISIS